MEGAGSSVPEKKKDKDIEVVQNLQSFFYNKNAKIHKSIENSCIENVSEMNNLYII